MLKLLKGGSFLEFCLCGTSYWSRSGRSTGGSLVFGEDPGISTQHGSRAGLPGEDPISKVGTSVTEVPCWNTAPRQHRFPQCSIHNEAELTLLFVPARNTARARQKGWGPLIQIFRICRHGKVPYRRFNSPEASAHVQVQRKYGWEPSNRVCGGRGAAAHACAPGLSTGRRLMPMPARCGAAAPCHGAATVRRSQHTRRVLLRVLLGSIQYSVMFIRGNGVTLRTQKVIQGGDNSHVGRPCEVSLAPPCPELFCELRGLCRRS